MKFKKVIGYILLALPFIAIFVVNVYRVGLLPTLGAFALTAIIVVIACLGVNLIYDE